MHRWMRATALQSTYRRTGAVIESGRLTRRAHPDSGGHSTLKPGNGPQAKAAEGNPYSTFRPRDPATVKARPRGRLKPKSATRQREDRDRAAMVAAKVEQVIENDLPHCVAADLAREVECGGPIDPHEPLARSRGGSVVDADNCVFICRRHHDWVHHEAPKRAGELGLLVPSWTRRGTNDARK
jgi:hypothetical protein